MLLVLGLMTALIMVMRAFPDTGIGRALHRRLVEAPARRLNQLKRGRVVFYTLLAAAGFVLVLLFEADGMRLFGLMLPDTLVWFAMFDVGVFVDALLIAGAVLATNGLRVMRAQAIAVRRRVWTITRRGAARARRALRSSSTSKGATSDDDRPAWAAQPPYRALSIA